MKKKKPPFYIEHNSTQVWWCMVHRRIATHVFFGMGFEPKINCDPKLGGIMISCRCTAISKPDGTPLPDNIVNHYKKNG